MPDLLFGLTYVLWGWFAAWMHSLDPNPIHCGGVISAWWTGDVFWFCVLAIVVLVFVLRSMLRI